MKNENIKPRISKGGIPWCDIDCPHVEYESGGTCCSAMAGSRIHTICIPAVSMLLDELDAWREHGNRYDMDDVELARNRTDTWLDNYRLHNEKRMLPTWERPDPLVVLP